MLETMGINGGKDKEINCSQTKSEFLRRFCQERNFNVMLKSNDTLHMKREKN